MDALIERFMIPIEGSTSEILHSFPKCGEFSNLDSREKGFWYESFVKTLLRVEGVSFYGNSDSYSNWSENQIEGYDIRLRYPNGETVKVECKLLLGPIYHSWFRRDWETRDADIYVTNSIYDIPYQDRKILRKEGKKLLSTTQFIMYIQKMTRGNKLSSLNNLLSYLNCTSNNSIMTVVTKNEKKEIESRENLLDFVDKKEALPKSTKLDTDVTRKVVPDCRICTKRKYCNIYSEFQSVMSLRPTKYGVQAALASYLEDKSPERKGSYKTRYKEWFEKYCDAFEKKFKCLNRREYLYYKLKLPISDEQPN